MLYRQTNNENSYQVRNTTEIGYLSHDKYPAQNTDYIGKWLCVRYKNEEYKEVNQRFHIPEGYYDDYIYPENSGLRNIFFRIIRWDLEEPFRAMLINTFGQVLVTYTDKLKNDLYDLTDSKILKATQNCARRKGIEYLILNETDDPDLFFDKLYYEDVKVYPLQDSKFISLKVWSEYDKDLYESRELDVLQYKNNNNYKLSKETMEEMIKRNPILYELPESIYDSFPYYYNPHEKGKIDDSRRAINTGYVIRADYDDYISPEFVVLEELGNQKIRFVTQHEANFYYCIDDLDKPKDFTKLSEIYQYISNRLNDIDDGLEREEEEESDDIDDDGLEPNNIDDDLEEESDDSY